MGGDGLQGGSVGWVAFPGSPQVAWRLALLLLVSWCMCLQPQRSATAEHDEFVAQFGSMVWGEGPCSPPVITPAQLAMSTTRQAVDVAAAMVSCVLTVIQGGDPLSAAAVSCWCNSLLCLLVLLTTLLQGCVLATLLVNGLVLLGCGSDAFLRVSTSCCKGLVGGGVCRHSCCARCTAVCGRTSVAYTEVCRPSQSWFDELVWLRWSRFGTGWPDGGAAALFRVSRVRAVRATRF